MRARNLESPDAAMPADSELPLIAYSIHHFCKFRLRRRAQQSTSSPTASNSLDRSPRPGFGEGQSALQSGTLDTGRDGGRKCSWPTLSGSLWQSRVIAMRRKIGIAQLRCFAAYKLEPRMAESG